MSSLSHRGSHVYIYRWLEEHLSPVKSAVFTSSVSFVADKNFEDEDSVDGGRSSSSSSSKAPPSGRRTVMSSVRRPSSATTAKASGEG